MTSKNGGSRKEIKKSKGYLRGEAELAAMASGHGKTGGSKYAAKRMEQIRENRRAEAMGAIPAAKEKPKKEPSIEELFSMESDSILDDYLAAIEGERAQKNALSEKFEVCGKLATNFYTGGATKDLPVFGWNVGIAPETDPAKRSKPAALLAVRGAEVESLYARKSYEWELSRFRGYTDHHGSLTQGDIKTVKAVATVGQMVGLLREWEKEAKSGGFYKQTLPGGMDALHHSKVDPYASPRIFQPMAEAPFGSASKLGLGL